MSLPKYFTAPPLLLLSTLPGLALAQEQGFIEDATATVQMRNFYFNRDYRDSAAPKAKSEEWARVSCSMRSPATPRALWGWAST